MSDRATELAAQIIRNFGEVPLERYTREPLYDGQGARLAPGTVARKLGATYDVLEPGKRGCPYHFHYAQEEAFVILEGAGSLRVAGEMLALKAGDTVFIPPGPAYPHQIVNTSDAPLKFLSISTKDSPEVVEYPDSGKYLAEARGPHGRSFDMIQKAAPSVDYWLDEP